MNNKLHISIAYILKDFPSVTETFILNEIEGIHRLNKNTKVLVLKKNRKLYKSRRYNELDENIYFLPKIYYFLFFIFLTGHLRIWIKQNFNIRKFRYYIISHYFKKKLRFENIDHIHAHFAFITTDIAKVLSGMLNIDYSFSTHANDIYTNSVDDLHSKINDARFIVTCTKYNLNYLNKITGNNYKEKIFHIYHGINIGNWADRSTGKSGNKRKYRILSVARLIEKKGLIYLIDAVLLLKQRGENIDCMIIGEGSLKSKLKKYIKKNRISDVIKIQPSCTQEEIREYMKLSDVFVLPSIIAENGDRDGVPNVITEAMLYCLPVISTNISGIPELIINEKTGILVSEKDSSAIAEAVLKIKNNRKIHQNIIDEGEKYIKANFNSELWISKLYELFNKKCNNSIVYK